MSCTVFAVPYALAWVVGGIIGGTALTLDFDNETETKSTADCDDVHVINEKLILEKTFETPFMDKNILLKTLEEHGAVEIQETDYGVIKCRTGSYVLNFEKTEADKPYFIKITCLKNNNPEEKIKDLENEYTLNVQEEAYLSIIDKLKENNLEVEDEEVQDDNTIVLTINLE